MKLNHITLLACLALAVVCRWPAAGEPATTDPHGEQDECCPADAEAPAESPHGAPNPHAAMNPHGAMMAADPHAGAIDDPRVIRISSRIMCPSCPASLLKDCSIEHRSGYARQIAKRLKDDVPDTIVIADFAETYGVDVLSNIHNSPEGEPAIGKLTGVAVNASNDDQPAPGSTIRLMHYEGEDGVVEAATAVTDVDGEFTFADLPIHEVSAYRLEADHDGQTYTSGWAMLAAERTETKVSLYLHDTTEDGSDLVARRIHIMADLREGALLISQVVLAENAGDRTVVAGEGSPGTFRISLPECADEISVSGVPGEQITIDGTTITYKDAFQPGMKQFVVQYGVRFDQARLKLAVPLEHDTLSADFIFPDIVGTRIAGSDFDQERRTKMGARPYRYLSASDRKAGGMLSIDLVLPVAPKNAFKWPALGIAVVAVLVFAASLNVRRSARPNNTRDDANV